MFGRDDQSQSGFVRFANDAFRIDALVHAAARAAAVLGELDDAEPAVRLERLRGIAQQRHRVLHLVIRVDDEDGVERPIGSLRIVRGAEARLDTVAEVLARQPALDRLRSSARWMSSA